MKKVRFCKKDLLSALPLREAKLTVREWTREDVNLLSAWPPYPFPYKGLELSFRGMSVTEKDSLFRTRQEQPDLLVLVADHAEATTIGYIALTRIDWSRRIFGNFGFRIHPAWCDRDIGTTILHEVTRWAFENGIELFRVDVAASNARAIRCYEKVGFVRKGEIWREALDLKDVDMSASQYDFLHSHVRVVNDVPRLRFLLMEFKHRSYKGVQSMGALNR